MKGERRCLTCGEEVILVQDRDRNRPFYWRHKRHWRHRMLCLSLKVDDFQITDFVEAAKILRKI